MLARVENGVTKFSQKKQKTPKFEILDQKQQFKFSIRNFNFFGRGKKNYFF